MLQRLYKKIRVMRAKEVEDNKHAVTRTLTLNYAYLDRGAGWPFKNIQNIFEVFLKQVLSIPEMVG